MKLSFYTTCLSITALSLCSTTLAEVTTIRNSSGMQFVEIPAGSFLMGSTMKERELALQEMLQQDQKPHRMDNCLDELPQHEVGLFVDMAK